MTSHTPPHDSRYSGRWPPRKKITPVTARWGCLIIALVMTALMLLTLVSVRLSGLPFSEGTAGEVTIPAEGGR